MHEYLTELAFEMAELDKRADEEGFEMRGRAVVCGGRWHRVLSARVDMFRIVYVVLDRSGAPGVVDPGSIASR